jgi:ABC-type multidrug transport system ATPase subunit
MPGGIAEGCVKINGEKLGPRDYAKLGAYVQQDDILVDVLTPSELLAFACRMRTDQNDAEIHETVTSIVRRLGLT